MSVDGTFLNPRPNAFSREEWFSLPLALRQRYWKETDYGKTKPSTELAGEIEKALAS